MSDKPKKRNKIVEEIRPSADPALGLKHDNPTQEEAADFMSWIQAADLSEIPDQPDPATKRDVFDYEARDLDKRRKEAEIDRLQAKADDAKATTNQHEQDNEARKLYATRFYRLTIGWLIGLMAIVVLQGFNFIPFYLDPRIILALIGATTINVLGFLAQVAAYLYSKKK